MQTKFWRCKTVARKGGRNLPPSSRLDRIVQEPGNRVLYYLQDRRERAFVSKELMRIPEDNLIPPEWVSNHACFCDFFGFRNIY